jgi:hypothetical protein
MTAGADQVQPAARFVVNEHRKYCQMGGQFMLAFSVLSGCAPQPRPDAHVPPFATRPYEPITRDAVVAIVLREWRLFGSRVDDDPPGSYRPATPEDKPERQEGLWQRVGEYWWLGMDAGQREAGWTGKHDANASQFPASQDATYAWSAAFVSYVMRIAGAGARFPYTATHAEYINLAKQMALGQARGWIITAEPPTSFAPRPGDLICASRNGGVPLRYDDLPAELFPSHCDFVVQSDRMTLTVVGGNVDDAVTMKHVPTTAEGLLAGPDGTVVDARYPWFVVIRLLDGEVAPSAGPNV